MLYHVGMTEDVKRGVESLEALSMEKLAGELKRRGADSFKNRYPHPFLVVVFVPPEESDAEEHRTRKASLSDYIPRGGRLSGMKAIPLVKTSRNVFSSKITVGRATNNDVIIRAQMISKAHATFILDDGNRIKLMDMGSANGTMINGKKLRKREMAAVTSGDTITFWRFVFEYQELDAFVQLLNGLS
jgi:translation elongation factor P/translation initiation factor 5A